MFCQFSQLLFSEGLVEETGHLQDFSTQILSNCFAVTTATRKSNWFLISSCLAPVSKMRIVSQFKFTTFGESHQPDVVTPRLHSVNLLRIPAVCRRHDESARFTPHESFIISGKELLVTFFLCFRYPVKLVFPVVGWHVLHDLAALNRLTHCRMPQTVDNYKKKSVRLELSLFFEAIAYENCAVNQ